MRYDLSLDNFFVDSMSGHDIEAALTASGYDVDYTVTGRNSGRLNYDNRDISGMARSGKFSNKLTGHVFSPACKFKFEFGEAE